MPFSVFFEPGKIRDFRRAFRLFFWVSSLFWPVPGKKPDARTLILFHLFRLGRLTWGLGRLPPPCSASGMHVLLGMPFNYSRPGGFALKVGSALKGLVD